MVTSSKILTVSYGTFSCTLEGFDDPFTTLQMVAEYFRKLAAEDRFFGGSPQMPDTEKLKQIARNATSRAVDAEVGESGIVLRQSTAPQEAALSDDAEATPFRSRRPVSQTTDPVEPAIRTSKPEKPAAKPTTTRQSVEATLAAIRQNVEKAGTGTALADSDTSDDDLDDQDEDQSDDFNLTADAATSAEDTREDSLFEPDADAEAETADAPVSQDMPADDTTLETIQAAMAETAAVDVVKSQKSAAEIEAEFDAEFEQAFSDPTPDVADAPAAELTEVEAEVEAEIITTPEPDVAEASVDIPEAEVEVEPEVAEVEVEETAVDEPVVDEIEEVALEVPSVRDALAKPENSILSDEEEEELARDLEAAVAVEDEPEQIIDAEAATRREQRRLRAEALRSGDDLEREEKALDRLLETTQSQMARPDQQRRLNALDQLKAAVAATEAEKQVKQKRVAKGHDEEEVDEQTADLAAYREDLRRAQSRARETGRAGLSGLRSAPPPLILVSEQRIANPAQADTAEPMEPHREVAESTGNLALKTAPAPETEAEDHRDPDRADGEIRGIPADAFKDSTSFADFAERIGAADMVELLEAAAAYTSIVEGQSRFSRAQAMSKIAKIAPDDTFSKEAGLRAFGKLLREGKILRVQDGQFAISKTSRFSIASRF
jgi:hypothetical protein